MATLIRSGQVAATKKVCGPLTTNVMFPLVGSRNRRSRVLATSTGTEARWTDHSNASSVLFTVSTKSVINISRRLAHTDIRFPRYDESARLDITNDPSVPARDTENSRRAVAQGLLYGASGAVYFILASKVVQGLITYKSMPADQLALANTEINLREIPEGQCKTFEWRGKPIFVAHRTEEDIKAAKDVNLSELRDAQTDDDRVKKEEWLVVIGVCPHLGCVPLAGKGEYGGYYCPCHGSTFDTSGRIRLGPAPNNLEVPPYTFIAEDRILIGSE